MSSIDIDQKVGRILSDIPGFVALYRIGSDDAREILRLESEAEKRAVLGSISAENLGVRESLKRGLVFAVAYRPRFFASFKGRLHGSSVVMTSGGDVVGEEVTDPGRLRKLKGKGGIILIGSSFVLYKDRVRKAGGEAKIVLPGRAFPPLEDLAGARDIISGSPSSPVDQYLKLKMNVDSNDPDIGTVIVGFTLVED
ncbi:MAG: hypothetical protein V3W09_02295 [Nitrososphaerales archaeon]